jgi:hypothetical protein
MNVIVVKSQKELDELPEKFEQFTTIEIRSDDNIMVNRCWGNSSVKAWDNSSVEAWDNSSVEGFLRSSIYVYSALVTINRLLDNARLVYMRDGCNRPGQIDSTAIITEFNTIIEPTFDQWLDRGFVVADGINLKLVSQKAIGDVTIFETTDFFEKEKSFVARKGDKFAHGNTIEEAKNDLRYKLSDRDKTRYEFWGIDEVRPIDEMIEAYMVITGACSFGTKQFCDSISLKDRYSPKEIIEITEGRYGHKEFKGFFNKGVEIDNV